MNNRPAPGSRSNRKVTQRMINCLADFCLLVPDHDNRTVFKRQIGPLNINWDSFVFEVYHSGNWIMTFEKDEERRLTAVLTTGAYHDSNGNPTSSTRELINGAMDALEAHDFMPYVRAYIEDGIGQLVIEDTVQQFNAAHPYTVIKGSEA